MAEISQWHIAGDWFDNCSCAVAAPLIAIPARLCHGNSIEHALEPRLAKRHAAATASCLCGSFGPEDPQCGSGDEMTLKVEGVVNRTVHAEEALGGSSRLESLQLALASWDCLMRILCPIVFPKPLLMPTSQSKTPERGGVGAQLVSDQQFRHEALLLEQLAHQPQRRPTVASALDQHVEDLALVIDGAPEIRPLAGDAHHQLVQMPAIARPRATLA